MNITVRDEGDNVTVALDARFDAHEVPAFRSALLPVLARTGVRLELDLAAVVFIDSSALAELVKLVKTLRVSGGDLVIGGRSPAVQVILELTGLEQAFTMSGDGAAVR